MVGTSATKVEKARTVLDHGPEDTKRAVLNGKKSIHAAAKEVQKKRKGSPDKSLPQLKSGDRLPSVVQDVKRNTDRISRLIQKLLPVHSFVERYCNNPSQEKNEQIQEVFKRFVSKAIELKHVVKDYNV